MRLLGTRHDRQAYWHRPQTSIRQRTAKHRHSHRRAYLEGGSGVEGWGTAEPAGGAAEVGVPSLIDQPGGGGPRPGLPQMVEPIRCSGI